MASMFGMKASNANVMRHDRETQQLNDLAAEPVHGENSDCVTWRGEHDEDDELGQRLAQQGMVSVQHG